MADEVEVVLNDEEGQTEALAELADVLGEPSDQCRIDTCAGLVEQDHFGLGHERAGQLQEFALAAGQCSGADVCLVPELSLFEDIVGTRFQSFLFASYASGQQPVSPGGLARLVLTGQHQILEDGHRVQFLGNLKCSDQSLVEHAMRR